jgi:ceramide glucosyltransferase
MSELLVVGWLLLACFFLTTAVVTMLRHRSPAAPPGELPRCSIILPIKGISNYLEENLAALARLEPFAGEILLAVASEQDAAAAPARAVVAKYPGKMKLMMGEAAGFENPKLRNVAKAYRAAKEAIILFLDDSVELTPALYAELLLSLKPGIVAVTAAPRGEDAETFFAEIEAASCNGYLFRLQMFLQQFGLAAAFGNAFCFRKQDLEAAGGFDRLKEGPCEDSAIASAMRGRGQRIQLLRSGIRRRIGKRSWSDIYLRHLRWANCTKVHDPIVFFVEPLIGGLFFNLLGAYALCVLLGIPCWGGLVLSMTIWYGTEALLHIACNWRMTLTTPLAWVARDALQPFFMVCARFTHTVDWRGEAIEMRR